MTTDNDLVSHLLLTWIVGVTPWDALTSNDGVPAQM